MNMPYLQAPRWAKTAVSVIYSIFYLWSAALFFAVGLEYEFLWVRVSMVVGALCALAALHSVWRKCPRLEWVASIFVLGSFFTYLLVQLYEAFTGATEFQPFLDASTGAGAIILLAARSVLLYVAVQKNKVFAPIKE